ncbi:hypothetical protein P3T76_006232 [Phytophthora citrophthora]|uniref:Uncharacterized protein n=1 Tax=Phytophthora citrophthora TaxID=4793 RepID=A0AAD9GR51_9STRA|nr:hypothetical protein P3T76_006232 [Phytophthora citrophthora]
MPQHKIAEKNWLNKYRILATSGQFSLKSDAAEFLELCLVPYWRQEDLEAIGKHKGWPESTVDARFFKSGGSLRYFLDAAFRVARLDVIEGPSHAERLLTGIGASSDKQINRIRMRGVRDRNNSDHYVDLEKWTSCVTSRAVLNLMIHKLSPNFFEKLADVARGMNDARLEGVVFEGYFHTLVRHRRPFHVNCYEYDNINRLMNDIRMNSMNKKYLIDCCPDEIKVENSGTNMEECVAVMKKWATNPSEMDYWIPAFSLCQTIDAVAKWSFPDQIERFCFLQLTMATKYTCSDDVLWKLVQPFVKKKLNV